MAPPIESTGSRWQALRGMRSAVSRGAGTGKKDYISSLSEQSQVALSTQNAQRDSAARSNSSNREDSGGHRYVAAATSISATGGAAGRMWDRVLRAKGSIQQKIAERAGHREEDNSEQDSHVARVLQKYYLETYDSVPSWLELPSSDGTGTAAHRSVSSRFNGPGSMGASATAYLDRQKQSGNSKNQYMPSSQLSKKKTLSLSKMYQASRSADHISGSNSDSIDHSGNKSNPAFSGKDFDYGSRTVRTQPQSRDQSIESNLSRMSLGGSHRPRIEKHQHYPKF